MVTTPNGTTSNALVVADIAHVLWAVNLGCLGLHLWPYRVDDPDHADELRIDLDPQPGTSFDDDPGRRRPTCAALLDELGIVGYPKTTGNRGLHVYVRLEPRWDSFEVRAGAVALARELERRHPELVTANWWKEERGERIFVDFNQNAPHKTVFGAWFARPRVGGQVSTPLAWDEIDTVDPEAADDPDRPRPGPATRRPLGGHRRRAAVAPAAVGHGGAGPGRRAARRAVAAGVPQAARRAAAGGAEPGQEGLTGGSGRGPAPHRLPARAGRRRDLQGAGLPQRRRRHRRHRPSTSWPAMTPARLQQIPDVGQDQRPGHHRGRSPARRPTTSQKLESVDRPAMSDGAAATARACCRATATATRTGPTAAARSARWPRRPRSLGHAYWALTDHSPRLTVAHGLDAERLRQQLDVVAELNDELAPFRILTGIEVDILEDGALDQDDELLAQLDVVVASVHSKLRMDAPGDDRADAAGRSRARTPTSSATAPAGSSSAGADRRRPSTPRPSSRRAPRTGTAVEINSRPERLDPPEPLLDLALSLGCVVTIDTDAHAPGPARVAALRLRAGGARPGCRPIGS